MLLVLAVLAARHSHQARESAAVSPVAEQEHAVPPVEAPTPSAFMHVVLPTPCTELLDAPITEVIQATASGRPESGLYGSVRTSGSGKGLVSSFHEGLDIAPVSRDRSGRALDDVFAMAEGRVGYINRQPGNSNYGNYVVVLHADPVGEVYTLYAHLAEIAPGLTEGQQVAAGKALGRMGRTPFSIIPVSRSHVHVEIGLIANEDFARWMVVQRTKNSHGRYNGWNFLGVDPLAALRAQREAGAAFTFLAHLATIPVAFELLIPTSRRPDFFQRYPRLWEGGEFHGPALVLTASEAGVPLRGRAATAAEVKRLQGKKPLVLHADATVLGRNGKHLVSSTRTGWVVGPQGKRWLDVLLYD